MLTIDPWADAEALDNSEAIREANRRRELSNGGKNDELLSRWGRRYVCYGRSALARAKRQENRAARRAVRLRLRKSL